MSTKSHKQQRLEAKDRKDNRKFLTVVIVATLILILLLYFVFSGMG